MTGRISRQKKGTGIRRKRFSTLCARKIKDYQEETGNFYNLEATPAEGTTYRFAKEDRKRFPEILQAGTAEAPYYTNSSQIPVGYTDDVFEVLELQDASPDEVYRRDGAPLLHE